MTAVMTMGGQRFERRDVAVSVLDASRAPTARVVATPTDAAMASRPRLAIFRAKPGEGWGGVVGDVIKKKRKKTDDWGRPRPDPCLAPYAWLEDVELNVGALRVT